MSACSPLRSSVPAPPPTRGLRLVHDAPASPSVRLRRWELLEPDGKRYEAGAHGSVELSWVEDGAVSYVIGGDRFDLGPRGAILVPSEVEHETVFPTAMRVWAAWIDRDLVAEVSDALGLGHAPPIGIVQDGARVAALGAVLAEEAQRGGRGALLAADAIVEAMLVVALRATSAAPTLTVAANSTAAPCDPAIAAAVRFVEEAYAEPLSVDAIARAARMSRFHFSRRFRQIMGCSPYRFLTHVRMDHAAELLRRGRHSVLETAFAVGCADPGRFARTFRARFGVGPRAYAKAMRARVTMALPLVKAPVA